MSDQESENVLANVFLSEGVNESEGNLYEGFNISQMGPSNGTSDNFYKSDMAVLSFILQSYVSGPICIFGILGNLLTLAVLTRRSLFKSMNIMERSSHMGLTALSISDLLYCVSVLPSAFLNSKVTNPLFPFYLEINFDLVYAVYHNGVVNIFITCSTLLTVVMAAQRYLAICYPLKARQLIEVKYTRIIVIGTFLFSILLNLPRFWRYQIIAGPCTVLKEEVFCSKGSHIYIQAPYVILLNKVAKNVYMSVFFIISIAMPLIVLMFCNFNLVKTLRGSLRIRRQLSNTRQVANYESTHRITLTLVIIVIMYIILVTPAEIHNFVWEFISTDQSSELANRQNFIAHLLAVFQNFNFSFNFILYCIINTHFRKTVIHLLFCTVLSRSGSIKTRSSASKSYNRTQSLDEVNLKSMSEHIHRRSDVIIDFPQEAKQLIMTNGYGKAGPLLTRSDLNLLEKTVQL